ncbi:MAG: hypothetical protein ACT4QE_03515 [Anaerolineales bacterium]
MTGTFSEVFGLVLPSDFEVKIFETVHFRVTGWARTPNTIEQAEYLGAASAIGYRFRACAEYDIEYSKSVKEDGDSPLPEGRFKQERTLFGFFVNGLATIESVYYGLYVIGSMLSVSGFPIQTDKERKLVTPEKTADQYTTEFPNDNLSQSITQLPSEPQYKEWKKIRNILAHRAAPGRLVGANPSPMWKVGIPIDINTTSTRRQWLAAKLSVILRHTDEFTQTHHP